MNNRLPDFAARLQRFRSSVYRELRPAQARLMLSDLDHLAKRLQKPGESYEQAYSRALDTTEGRRAYEEYRDAHRNIGSRSNPTSSDADVIKKAFNARESVMYRVEAEARRRFSDATPQSISKLLETDQGRALYEEYRKAVQ